MFVPGDIQCRRMRRDVSKRVLRHTAQTSDWPLGVKIGINAGAPVREDNDHFGTTVQRAARIVDKANNYQIPVSKIVRGICAGTAIKFNNRGQHAPKNIEDKMSLYEVVWGDAEGRELETMIQNRQGLA